MVKMSGRHVASMNGITGHVIFGLASSWWFVDSSVYWSIGLSVRCSDGPPVGPSVYWSFGRSVRCSVVLLVRRSIDVSVRRSTGLSIRSPIGLPVIPLYQFTGQSVDRSLIASFDRSFIIPSFPPFHQPTSHSPFVFVSLQRVVVITVSYHFQ